MKRLVLTLILLAAAVPARASLAVFVTEAPAWMEAGQSVDWTVGIDVSSDAVTGFQLNVAFSDWLTPGAAAELGYFAANGIFFFPGIATGDSITFISDALSGGDVLPFGFHPLVTITFTATQSGAPQLELLDPVFTLESGSDATIGSYTYTEPTVIDPEPLPGSEVPEPSTLALAGSAIAALALARRRGVRR